MKIFPCVWYSTRNSLFRLFGFLKQSKKNLLRFPNKIPSVLVGQLDPCATFPIRSFSQSEPDSAYSKSLSPIKALIDLVTFQQLRTNQMEALWEFRLEMLILMQSLASIR